MPKRAPVVLLGVLIGLSTFVVEYLVLVALGVLEAGSTGSHLDYLWYYLPFPIAAFLAARAVDRPALRSGVSVGIAGAVIGWILFIQTNLTDDAFFALPPIAAWAIGSLIGTRDIGDWMLRTILSWREGPDDTTESPPPEDVAE